MATEFITDDDGTWRIERYEDGSERVRVLELPSPTRVAEDARLDLETFRVWATEVTEEIDALAVTVTWEDFRSGMLEIVKRQTQYARASRILGLLQE